MDTPPEPEVLPWDDPDWFPRFLAASVPIFLCYVGLDFRFRYANDAYARWVGRRASDLVGAPVSEVIGPAAYALIQPFLEQALSGKDVSFEREAPYGPNDQSIVHVNYIPDRDKSGVVRGLAVVVTDITERRRAERQLEESHQQYQSLFDRNPDAVFSFDTAGHFVTANAACEAVSGYRVDEILGMSFTPLIAPGDVAQTMQRFSRALRGEAQKYEITLIHKQGRTIRVEVTNIPMVVAGAVVGVYGVAKDITDRQRADAERRQVQEELALVVAGARCVLWRADVFERPGEPWLHWETVYADEATAQRQFGILVSPDEEFAAAWHRCRFPEDREHNDEEAARCVRASEDYSQEFRCVRADGSFAWMREDVRVLSVIPGQWRLIGVTTDITDRKQAEEERERLLREAQTGAARQRAFLQDVLASVTDNRLRLCENAKDLPKRLPSLGPPIPLSKAGGLGSLRRRTSEAALAHHFSADRGYDLISAVNEAGMNAIVHAGRGRGEVCGDGKERLQVWIVDHGSGIAVEHLPRATLARGYSTASTLGHGMKMMLQLADRIFLLTGPQGTTVVLEQDRDPTPPDWLA